MRAGAKTTTDALAERARAFDLGVFERASDRVVRDERATLISTPTLRSVPHLHGVVLHAQMAVGDAEALADDLLGDLPFRRLLVPDEALVEPLEARGWHHEPVLLLARDGGLDPPSADALAEEVPYGHVRGLPDEWIRSAPWADREEEVRNAHEADRRMLEGTPARAFATFEQGRPLAYALLLDGGTDGMLEDVFTSASARGRGLATAVCAAVLHAARAERHEFVFVPTDAGAGGAGPLYEKLGFERVTILHWLRKGDP